MKKILWLLLLFVLPLLAQQENVRRGDSTGGRNNTNMYVTPYYLTNYIGTYVPDYLDTYVPNKLTLAISGGGFGTPIAGKVIYYLGHFYGSDGINWTRLDMASIGTAAFADSSLVSAYAYVANTAGTANNSSQLGGYNPSHYLTTTSGIGTITQGRFDTLLSGVHILPIIGDFQITNSGGNMNFFTDGYLGLISGNSSMVLQGSDSSINLSVSRINWTAIGQDNLPIMELVYDPTENLITEHIYTTFNQEYDDDISRYVSGYVTDNIDGDLTENAGGNIQLISGSNIQLQGRGFTYNGSNVIPQKGQVTFDDNGGNDSLAAVGNSCHTGLIITSANIVTVTPVGSVTGVHGYSSINANDYLSVTVYGGYFIIQRKPGGTPYLTVNWSLQ